MRRYLTEGEFAHNSRLPAERHLCDELDISRGELRKSLAILESEGLIWRHVGRGTFVGSRPVENIDDVDYLASQTRPAEVMEARLTIEPELARLAAVHATNTDFAQMRICVRGSKAAQQWRVYEAWDNKLHHAIAAATHNKVLISLFDKLNLVRRSTVWGQLRSTTLPPSDHHSFREHDAMLEAISQREPALAAERMRKHLQSVRDRVLASLNS